MTKRISLLSAVAFAAAVAVPALSFAQTPYAIVHDARNNPVRDDNGNCVRTLYGAHTNECGGQPAPVAEKAHTRLASVYFDFNKADLNKKAKSTLDKLLVTLHNKKIEAVTIDGYADAVGSESYNMQLSKKRAEAVKKYLNDHGFHHAGTEMHGRGEGDSTASSCKGKKDGALHACMQEDRRVDIELSVLSAK